MSCECVLLLDRHCVGEFLCYLQASSHKARTQAGIDPTKVDEQWAGEASLATSF